MKIIKIIDDALLRVVDTVLILLFFLMLGLSISQVTMRYFFGGGTLWGDIAARELVLWVGFLGAVIATRESKHFHIDVLTRFLKKRHQYWLQSFSNLFSAVVCYYLGQASITFVQLDPQGKTILNVPTMVMSSIIPIGFFVMMIQFVIQMVGNIHAGFTFASTSDQEVS